MNGPGGGGCMPPALCINLNLLVCLVGKLSVSQREGRVFAPGLRYTEAGRGGALLESGRLCAPALYHLLG